MSLIRRLVGWLRGLLPWRRAARGETVILLHGLGMGPGQLGVLRKRLERAGYRVVAPSYPSTKATIEELVAWLADMVEEAESEGDGAGAGRLHFVTHSLGGILVRAYLGQRASPFGGRVVMLAPPNQGSEVVDAFRKSPLLTKMLGPVGARLGTDEESIPSGLPPADFDVGIITGTRSLNPVGALFLPGPNDGSVSVERARLEGAGAFKVIEATHTFLMNRKDVARDVLRYLEEGRFAD